MIFETDSFEDVKIMVSSLKRESDEDLAQDYWVISQCRHICNLAEPDPLIGSYLDWVEGYVLQEIAERFTFAHLGKHCPQYPEE